ncbi:hypothetical protein J6590_018827 [Homalodisca vitripennis]|nr:hypothetical protein J6590_018827 [Homalodisca vitripennis]
MPFSNEEAFQMLMVLGECFQNYSAAALLYAQRYPDREHHSRNVFQRLASRVRDTGHVKPDHNWDVFVKMYETDIGEAHYSAFHVFSTFRIAISPLKVKCTYFCVAISPPPRHPSHIQYPIFKLRKYEYSRWTVHCRDCLSSGGEEARWVT